MATVNPNGKEIIFKIVYYGPALSGKTTNLQKISQLNQTKEPSSKLISLTTEGERTIFFDYLPLSFGRIKGFTTRYQLYTVPGQVYYNSTRRIILKGCDGVVFVADSQKHKMKENLESLASLKKNLYFHGKSFENMPVIFQFNKRDADDALTITDINTIINPKRNLFIPAIAIKGRGIVDTLKGICRASIKKTFTTS